jgi:hypothetical protein
MDIGAVGPADGILFDWKLAWAILDDTYGAIDSPMEDDVPIVDESQASGSTFNHANLEASTGPVVNTLQTIILAILDDIMPQAISLNERYINIQGLINNGTPKLLAPGKSLEAFKSRLRVEFCN